MIAIIDFNVPNARDSMKLKEMAASVATIFKSFGADRCVLLAHMAAYSKEDTDIDPTDDEYEIKNIFAKAGFNAQQRVRMLLNNPESTQRSMKVGDWHADSRLLYIAPNDMAARGDGAPGNSWRMKSELARTTQIVSRPTLPLPQDYVHVTSESGSVDARSYMTPDSKFNKADKAAQRGPQVSKVYLESLIRKTATAAADPDDQLTWMNPADVVYVLDVMPWAGDRAMASLEVVTTGSASQDKHCKVRHILVDPGYKRMGVGAQFSRARVANQVASDWISRSRVLYDYIIDGSQQLNKVAKYPAQSVPDPDEDVLKKTPGAYEAWKGLSELPLKVCKVSGAKVVIDPEKLQQFTHAPADLSDELHELELQHKAYEEKLAFMADDDIRKGEGADDPRPDDDPKPVDPEKEGATEWVKFDTLEALRNHAPSLTSHPAMGDKQVTLLRDDKRGELWVMSKDGDHTLNKNIVLGGFGSGSLKPRDLMDDSSDTQGVPFGLQNGDKTYVEVITGVDDEGKAKRGSFYSLVKPLEKKAAVKGMSLKVTSYGKLIPEGSAGNHSFSFEFPESHEKHKAMDFVLVQAKKDKTISSGNLFGPLAPPQWQGACEPMWRFTHDPVHHVMTPKKPFVITNQSIKLAKGEALKILWKKAQE